MPERHGVMWDLAASEDVRFKAGESKVIPLGVSMKLPEGYFGELYPRSSTCLKHGIVAGNSVGIIENEYCGKDDVWGFVAVAFRDTVITQGTRIAQFMPVKMPEDVEFEVSCSEDWGYCNRGGYGSTGEKSAEGHTAEGSPHDCEGVPIEVGDTVFCDDDHEQLVVDSFDDQGCVCITLAKSPNGILYTIEPSRLFHECPDSWEKLEEAARKRICDYAHAPRDDDGLEMCDGCRFHKPETGLNCIQSFGVDLVKRAKRLAGVEGDQR